MIYAISQTNRRHFAPMLGAMHYDRGRIFAGRHNWDLAADGATYAQDCFDTLDNVYLVASDSLRRVHHASVRLLPSTGPHLLGSKYAFLCETEVPVSDAIWELGRFCASPDLAVPERSRTRLLLAAGLLEFALLNDIAQLTAIIRTRWLPQILSAGWECAPLGPIRTVNGDSVGAISIRVCSEALQNFRTWLGLSGPALRLEASAQAA